jgi:hypothetical protein
MAAAAAVGAGAATAAVAAAAAAAAAAYCRGCLLFIVKIFLSGIFVWGESARSHLPSHTRHA